MLLYCSWWWLCRLTTCLYYNQCQRSLFIRELCSLKIAKSTGLDEIPAKFLKLGASVLKKPITAIINQSITPCTVPSSMKEARVKPLYKKGSQLDVGK